MNQIQSQPNKFILSLSGSNIDISIINTEEMTGYCASHNRTASIVTEKKTYDELDKLNYSLIMNYTKPKARVINSKSKPYVNVFNSLAENYKAGLLIAESDTLSEPISEMLCNSAKWNDVDIMVCRSFKTLTKEEIARANYIRISADPDFDPSVLPTYEDILKEKVLTLMIIQFFVNENYNLVNAYIDKQNEYFGSQGKKEYIDYYELNKQLAYFVYFDLSCNKVLNVNKDTMLTFIKKLSSQGIIPCTDDVAVQLAETITLE